jgi:hypothetical protein
LKLRRYRQALGDGLVYNALDACKALGVDADGLDRKWAARAYTRPLFSST